MDLTITADDYGLAVPVNAGIERLARGGFVTAASVMVHRDAVLDSVPALAATGVSTGIHLVLVEERPLVDAGDDRLVAPGESRLPLRYAHLFARLLARPSARHAVRREIEAQFDRYDRLGIPLHFINSHQHVHEFPLVWPAVADVIERRPGVAVRHAAAGVLGPSRQGLLTLSSRLSEHVRTPPDGHPRLTPIGVDFAGRATLRSVERALAQCRARPGRSWELVVHPGHHDRELRSRYAHWNYHWSDELTLLESADFAAVIDRSGFRLRRPAELRRG